MINSAGTESKYGLKLTIPNSTGIVGSSDGESVFAETKVRLEILNVGPTFTMDVEGQVKNSPNWYPITTITGAITGTLDISTYDRIRYNVTNADGSGVLLASGFILNAQPLKFNNAGELLTATTGWQIRLVIDTTEEVFGATGLLTSEVDTLYTYTIGTSNTPRAGAGLGTTTSMFYWSSPLDSPIKYNSKVQVFVMRATGQIAKTFNAGLLTLTKDT